MPTVEIMKNNLNKFPAHPIHAQPARLLHPTSCLRKAGIRIASFGVYIAALMVASIPSPLDAASQSTRNDVIRIEGIREWPSENPSGKLFMAAGLTTSVVLRSDREHPALSDGRGWTFQHHPGMAAWRGRLYVAWDSGEKDEDTWPARQLYSTSSDGKTWSKPQELFPQGSSAPLRMWFFRAPNDTMLAIAGVRVSNNKTIEKIKSGLLVRRINDDHSLGPVHILRQPDTWRDGTLEPMDALKPLAMFGKSADAQFTDACRALLANHTFLMQQDFGNLMDKSDRMSWARDLDWGDTSFTQKDRDTFAKAFSFFHRKDGTLVGICKQRFTVLSNNEGKTWSKPVKPPTLVTGNAKVWCQRTADGRYALVYNPHPVNRFPLIVVSGDDGITFKDMCVISPGTDPQRYKGKNKDYGAQYVRGIDEWSDDGSWKDANALWLVYSMNKEDILVTRVPLPIRPDTTGVPVNAQRNDPKPAKPSQKNIPASALPE